MIDPLFLGFGLGLVALGVASGLHLRRQRADDAARTDLRNWERGFRAARRRRRGKVAGLLIFAGAAIPAGDLLLTALDPKVAGPLLAAYLVVLLAAAGGMIALALLDSFATAVHTRDRVADLHAGRAALEQELRTALARARAAEAVRDQSGDAPRRPLRNRLRDYSFDE